MNIRLVFKAKVGSDTTNVLDVYVLAETSMQRALKVADQQAQTDYGKGIHVLMIEETNMTMIVPE